MRDTFADGKTNFFDTLPIHPYPLALESKTSYIIRLADLNRIKSIDGIAALLFPEQSTRVIRALDDYPALSLLSVAKATGHSEEKLLATTFYHLARKFNRSSNPQSVSRFLTGTVAQHLRYCPLCIMESGYYSLLWRFVHLEECQLHGCKLQDACCHCKMSIPIFTTPLKIGICPKCGYKLTQTDTQRDCNYKLSSPTTISKTLDFFVQPQKWELFSKSVCYLVGQQFAFLRKQKKLSIREAPQYIGITEMALRGIEHADLTRGASFRSYLKYADFLKIPLEEIFLAASQKAK